MDERAKLYLRNQDLVKMIRQLEAKNGVLEQTRQKLVDHFVREVQRAPWFGSGWIVNKVQRHSDWIVAIKPPAWIKRGLGFEIGLVPIVDAVNKDTNPWVGWYVQGEKLASDNEIQSSFVERFADELEAHWDAPEWEDKECWPFVKYFSYVDFADEQAAVKKVLGLIGLLAGYLEQLDGIM
jgi:hypothetical protein